MSDAIVLAKPLLELSNIRHSFGGLSVLREVSFSVPEGGLVGLIGPNGSGKTTLFNIISGFLQPKGGTVRYADEDITGESILARSRRGLVRTFQTPKVFEHMSVLENVMAGFHKSTDTQFVQNILQTRAARRELRETREAALAICERFDLGPLAHTRAGKLPAGQRRNLELARALAGKPRLLLLDEPSSGLNTEEIEHLAKWLQVLNREEGLTILLVSHDMELMGIASQVDVLYFGEMIAKGSMEEIQQNPQVREAYLGM